MKPLEQLRHTVAEVIGPLSPQQLRWHPEGKWSAAEILEHLYLSYTGTIKGFERIAAVGQPKVTPPNWRQRARKLILIGFGHMPSGREAPPMTRPRGLPSQQVVMDIVPKIAEMEEIIARCEKTLGRGDLLNHPVLGPLTGEEWRKFHLVHGLHHVKQIRLLMISRSE